jgi:alpha-beta hydrolase superfamily lysophospholipase
MEQTGQPRPVIAWAHGTTGLARGCAPSVMSKPLANVPAFEGLIAEGWVYVATDYAGLGTAGGHQYLVGDDAARAVLDSVRAVRSLKELSLDNRVVVWGHSQGGNSALWTGIRAKDYAPDVNLLAVAALAPASDLRALFAAGRSSVFGKIVSSYLIEAYAAVYPDVNVSDYVYPRARALVRDIAARCVGGWETLFSVFETWFLPADGIFAMDPSSGTLGERLLSNTPSGRIEAPVLIAQGEIDDLVLPDLQGRFAAARCAANQSVDYRRYEGRDHLSLVAPDSPLTADLIAWTRARLAGDVASSVCLP